MQTHWTLLSLLVGIVLVGAPLSRGADGPGEKLPEPYQPDDDLLGGYSVEAEDGDREEARLVDEEPGIADDDAENSADGQQELVGYEGPRWFGAPGRVLPLVLTGRDQSYRIRGSPNRFVVYQHNAYGERLRYFVMEGIDPRRIREIRPGEFELVYVSFRRFIPLHMPDGRVRVFPLLRASGTSTVLGVGGEVMYFK
jgi:hypothetical protein